MKFVLKTITSVYFLFFISYTSAADRMQIVVSIMPQKYFVEQITYDEADVHVMVGSADNPATYEPKPSQMALLSKADFYFTIGVPFEQAWMKRVQQLNPNMIVIATGELSFFEEINHDHSHNHNHDNDPHIWTSPKNVKEIATKITTVLAKSKPEQANVYQNRLNKFENELAELDDYIKTKIHGLTNRTLIVTHPSWGHYADRYGLDQVSIEQEGQTIKAASLKALIDFAKANNIKAVFGQPQFSNKAANILAREIDGNVYMLDPLSYDYMNNIKEATEIISKALANE